MVACSADISEFNQKKCKKYDFEEIIFKPVKIERLRKIINIKI